jgi:hypothetical protein
MVLGLVALSPGTAGAHAPLLHGQAPSEIGSTVPGNGDVNPYGVAVVPASVGRLEKGNVLVSNFNASTPSNPGGLQGTGTTIVQLQPGDAPNATPKVFATVHLGPGQQCPGGVGLTTALAVFPSGWVVVGSLPTSDGTSATEHAGCLIVLDAWGHVVRTISGGHINGPWDMTAAQVGDEGVLFVSNVLNGLSPTAPPTHVVRKGTVVRVVLDLGGRVPRVDSETVIASGFPERNDPAALVVGPTGVGLSPDGSVLYVADTEDNQVTSVRHPFSLQGPTAGSGSVLSAGGALNFPLGLTVTREGDVITVNSLDGNGVEIAPNGMQVSPPTLLDNTGTGGGTLFGLAVAPHDGGLYFVNDGSNQLDVVTP